MTEGTDSVCRDRGDRPPACPSAAGSRAGHSDPGQTSGLSPRYGRPGHVRVEDAQPRGDRPRLEKAERYRLLNEPEEAESICLDILAIAPDNQQALVTLLLALTDQFPHGAPDAVRQVQEVVARLEGDYERAYYAGIICERRASARLHGRGSGAEAVAYDLYRQAMQWYERGRVEPVRQRGRPAAVEHVRPPDHAAQAGPGRRGGPRADLVRVGTFPLEIGRPTG